MSVLLLDKRSTAAADAVASLGWSQNVGAAGNAAALNAHLASYANTRPVIIPRGRYETTAKIVTAARWPGGEFHGAGISKDLGENHYGAEAGLLGGHAARIVWRGNATDPMFEDNGGGSRFTGLALQGRPVSGGGPGPAAGAEELVSPAAVGIHYQHSSGTGATNGAKSYLEQLSFYQIKTGVLCGPLSGAAGTQNHADSLAASSLHFYFPYGASVSDAFQPGTGYGFHFRNDQSVSHVLTGMYFNGSPRAAIYAERGGALVVNGLSYSGPTGTVYRFGMTDLNQSSFVANGTWIDGVATNVCLLEQDNTYQIAYPHFVFNGVKNPQTNTGQLLKARHGYIELNGLNFLHANSLLLNAFRYDTDTWQAVHVHLRGACLFGFSDPREAIHASSTGPYRLTWQNCTRWIGDGSGDASSSVLPNFGMPIADGDFIAANSTNYALITN